MKLDFRFGRTASGDSSLSVPQPEKAPVHSPESGEFREIERRAEDERLRQSETLYHSLVASLPQCIMRKDRAGRFIFVNQRFADMLHASPEQVLGRTDFDFYPAEMARKFRADDQRVMATGELLETIEENLSANGVLRDVHVLKIPIRDGAGEIVGIQCVFWDVTASRQAQREIQRRDVLLQAIMDHTPAVIYMKDLEGRYLYINREYEKLFNVQREQTIGKTDFDIFPPAYAQKFQANDRAILAAGRPRSVDEKVPHGDDPRDYLSVKFPVLDSAGKPYALCGISTDITGRKQMETQLAQRNRELRNALAELQDVRMHLIQVEKLKAVGTLAAGIAHEVKNPLQTILLGLSGLKQTLGTIGPETGERLQGMREAIERANQIVCDLLDYARPDPLQLRWMNYTLRDARVAVGFRGEPRLPRLALDRLKMQQVLMNLLTNSVQAMEQLPELRRRIEIHVGTEPLLSLGTARGVGDTTCWQPGDDLVVVELSDGGTGIPAHLLGRVFDPFFTTTAPGRGTGLGLHIVQNIIALHGGTIDISNRPEGGTRVRIVLNPKKNRTHHEKTPHPRR
jgi:two-component system, NtrC family, sensor kinase